MADLPSYLGYQVLQALRQCRWYGYCDDDWGDARMSEEIAACGDYDARSPYPRDPLGFAASCLCLVNAAMRDLGVSTVNDLNAYFVIRGLDIGERKQSWRSPEDRHAELLRKIEESTRAEEAEREERRAQKAERAARRQQREALKARGGKASG